MLDVGRPARTPQRPHRRSSGKSEVKRTDHRPDRREVHVGAILVHDPLTRGSGPRLFPDDAAPRALSLAASESYDNGVLYLAYRLQQ